MNKGNATILSVIALALVVALGVTYFGTTTPRGEKGDKGDRGESGNPGLTVTGPKGENGEVDTVVLRNLQNVLRSLSDTISTLPKSNLGSFSGYDISVPFLGINDIDTYYRRVSLGSSWAGTAGTTTPCRIQAPTNATSTLAFGYPKIHINGQATDTYIQLGRATAAKNDGNVFATTTQIGNDMQLAANTALDVVASTTALQTANGATTFAPAEWFVMKIAGGTNGTQRLTGTCETVFQTF